MKKNVLKKMVLMSCLILMLTSCKELYFQVYTLDSNQLKMQNNCMEYKNTDCRVTYNFWSNGGIVAFAVENLTDKDIFVNMNESFLVVNGNAHNYFEDKTYTCGTTNTVELGYGESLSVSITGKNFWDRQKYESGTAAAAASISSKSSVFNSVSQKEQEVICIPARSFKVFSKFCLSPDLYVKCVKDVDYPSKKASAVTFTSENSPLKINNRFTYGFSKENMDKHFDNVFWLSEIVNYSEKSAIEKKREQGCYDVYDHKVRRFKIGTPSQFYKDYNYKGPF